MKKVFLFLSIIMFSNAIAQLDKEKALSPRAELRLADLLYAEGLYYSASEYYKEVLREKPNWRYARYWLAMSYAKSHDYTNAEIWFDKFVNYRLQEKDNIKRIERENKTIFNKARYYYAQALKSNGKYEESIIEFNAFVSEFDLEKNNKKAKNEQNWNARAKLEIKGSEMALEMADNKRKVKVKALGANLNTGYEEAAPVPINDSVIYYTSLNKDDLIYVDKAKDIPPYRIYESTKVNGVWQKGKMLPSYINKEKYATGNATISEDGKRMYFCTCYNNEIDEIICAINFSEKDGDKWSESVLLNKEINDPRFTATQPSVRAGGDNFDLVYFVSDREGGKGGMDIWYFIRTARGDLKGPQLLKGSINTEFDELTPFYSNMDSMLYFSSNGHPGIGGFDIFYTTENDELQWVEPVNVGKPINSPADDLYYNRVQGKTSGFLVSNRDGTALINKRYRGDDIFYFEDFKFGLEGLIVKDGNVETGKTLIDDAKVKLYTIDSEANRVFVAEVDAKNGKYFFNLKPDMDYTLEVIKPGFSTSFEEISTKHLVEEDTLSRELVVTKTRIVATGNLYSDTDILKKTKLKDALVVLMEKQTDGSFKTITAAKISEKNPNYYFDLDILKNYEIKVTKEGYFANTFAIDFTTISENTDTIINNTFISKIELGKTYALDNILYEFGKASLTSESKKIIEGLAKKMQENPLIIVELSAHTDAVGSDAANLKLSQARAQSCVDYLKELGVSGTRLVAKGYGESMPVAENQNKDGSDNEAGRAKNRRTEFKVLGGL